MTQPDKLIGADNCNKAFFQVGDTHYPLCLVDEVTINQMMHHPKTGQPIEITGYPTYYTRSGKLWPLPKQGIEVKYER